MQLTVRRSQRKAGMISKDVLFCLHAQIRLSNEERHAIDEYKIGKLSVYDSEKRRERADKTREAIARQNIIGAVAGMARTAMSLRLTIDNLTSGQLIECKSLDEVLDAEVAIREACEICKQYIDVARRFNGTEETIDFN